MALKHFVFATAMICAWLVSTSAHGANVFGVTIVQTASDNATGAFFIYMSGPPHAQDNACATQSNRYVIPATAKTTIAQAMLAFAQASTIDIYGLSDACGTWPDTEAVRYLFVRH
jgi:hypothetical protein